MTPGALDHVRKDPHGCAQWLTADDTTGGITVTVVLHDCAMTVFDVRYEPPPPDRLPGYPAEQVRITVRGDGKVYAVPVNANNRRWLHRYPHPEAADLLDLPTAPVAWETLFGSFCLEYPHDPDHLRWHWKDGIDAYLRIVQRHLWFEQYWRRHDAWPVEDAPHGHRADGRPHDLGNPILWNAA